MAFIIVHNLHRVEGLEVHTTHKPPHSSTIRSHCAISAITRAASALTFNETFLWGLSALEGEQGNVSQAWTRSRRKVGITAGGLSLFSSERGEVFLRIPFLGVRLLEDRVDRLTLLDEKEGKSSWKVTRFFCTSDLLLFLLLLATLAVVRGII